MNTSLLLQPGANAPLSQSAFNITFRTGQIPGADIDISAFLVAAGGKVRADEDMCFYGQPVIENGALALVGATPGEAVFGIDLVRLPSSVEKVVFAATIHENRATFASLSELRYQIAGSGPAGSIPCAGRTETAMLMAEAYRHKGAWKIRTIGQGFNGGLAALATHLGVTIETPKPAPVPPPVVASPRPVPPPPAAPISLKKISLTKQSSSVSLKKTGSNFGQIRVNLNWNQKPASGGLLGGLLGSKQLDLDLGCFIEDKYGNKTCVQALGNTFGDYDYFPYAKLRGDDRTGAVRDGEWLDINGRMWPEFNRILIFAFIYSGAPNWQQTDGVVRVLIPDQPEVEVRMNEYGSSKAMCAVASIENDGGQMKLNREVLFFGGHSHMDRHYGWGMNWVAGSK